MMRKLTILLLASAACIDIRLCIAQKLHLGLPIGHTSVVYYAEFSGDGKKIVTASWDNTAKIWDAASGKLIYNLSGHSDDVNYASFSPDGNKVITSSSDNTVKVWDTNNGNLLLNLTGHMNVVNYATFSPDGSKILSASDDKRAMIWNSETGELLQTFALKNHGIKKAIFDHSGTKIVTISGDSIVTLWDALNGKQILLLKGHKSAVNDACFSPDDKTIVTASEDSTAILWDVNNGKIRFRLKGHKRQLYKASFSNDGSMIVTASEDGSAIAWNVADGSMIYRMSHGTEPVIDANFSPDNKSIVTASWDNTAKIWNAKDGSLLYELSGHTNLLYSARFNPDSRRIVTASWDNTAKIWDTGNGKLLYDLKGHTHSVSSADFSPDGKNIVSAMENGTAKIWDAENGSLILNINAHADEITSVKYNSAGNRIVTSSADKTAGVWDAATGKLIAILKGHESEINSAEFSPDGTKIVTASWDNTAKIWETESGKLIADLVFKSGVVTSASFSPDGNEVITSSWDDSPKIWNAEDGKFLFDLPSDYIGSNLVRFSPDGKKIVAVSSGGRTAVVIDAENFKSLFYLKGHTANIESVQFSYDSKRIVTASSDHSLILWNAGNGEKLAEMKGHTGTVRSACFSHDGSKILSSSTDTRCILWEADSGKELLSWMAIDSTDNIIMHTSGLFDASPAAMKQMFWMADNNVIELEQVKERYWEPGLWEKIIAKIKLRDVTNKDFIKLQPLVELSEVTNGVLAITLTKREGGYGRISVMINNIEDTLDLRGSGFDTTSPKQVIYYNLDSRKHIQSGNENIITVNAWSSDGSIEGKGISVSYLPTYVKGLVDPALYAIVLGVSDYSNEKLNLRYARKDACSVSTAIKLSADNLFSGNTFVYTLTSPGDKLPNKENIRNTFNEISKLARPEDVFVLYMSGHGVSSGNAESGDFYYLTCDATSKSLADYSDSSYLAKYCVSTIEFTEWMNSIPALKRVVMIDACGSGKAIDNLVQPKTIEQSQIKAIDRMKDRTGMFVITGCAADQKSYEAYRYGQSLLTYTLLQGMRGAALRKNYYVDVFTLLNYAQEEVPKLAEGLGGIQQPLLLMPGSGSFDIGIMDTVSRNKIPLSNPGMLLLRSNFLEQEEHEDVLDLSSKIDDALNEMTEKDKNCNIIFLDARSYPGAYKISGTYTVKGNKIKINYRLRCENTILDKEVTAGSNDEAVKMIIEQVMDYMNIKHE